MLNEQINEITYAIDDMEGAERGTLDRKADGKPEEKAGGTA